MPTQTICAEIAERWENYGGSTPWTKSLRAFGDVGGQIIYWCGMPGSKSAIPLTFELIMPDGSRFVAADGGAYRLKDIRAAITQATKEE